MKKTVKFKATGTAYPRKPADPTAIKDDFMMDFPLPPRFAQERISKSSIVQVKTK